ncbi:hypothetical protein CH379_011185 [Leptospira ellisii]|uniref:Uncharacterized protein n=1 Tax=Leptospira ellisii TaxID=2023197 RepID=A0A2N0B970_9LEPT|nr:hypothetical protein [Leptospira ellisii]MDV6236186.1 hypothetical protein [Leptospira ellisii]PJZ93038.1 hypothetical protein CH379_10015 [Leptospira ellisii]PKA03440.1 hypothetical protein CH375_16985 [Leptospira ellisii]
MSDQTTKQNSEESANSISAKKDNFYSNHPTGDEIEEKVSALETELLRLPELKPFLELLSSLPWNEYEEKLSSNYYASFPFGKEDSDSSFPTFPSEKPSEFKLLEPVRILAEAEERLGAENENFRSLNNYVSNLIARTMGRAVSIAVKTRLNL